MPKIEVDLSPRKIFFGFKKWAKTQSLGSMGGEVKKNALLILEHFQNIHILGKKEPLSLEEVYIKPNLLEKPRNLLRLNLQELRKWEERYKKELKITQKRLDCLEAVREHSHLILLGQPGSGKTTFLKYLILQAAKGNLPRSRFPLFISLKDWAESEYEDLIEFTIHIVEQYGIEKAQNFISKALKSGKCLFLLDGLNEVNGSPRFGAMQEQIKTLAEEYDNNQFIISCRLASYNQYFTQFSDVELAEFDEQQRIEFIKLWFTENHSMSDECLNELNKEENTHIRKIANTPMLLTLACLIFEQGGNLPSRLTDIFRNSLATSLSLWDKHSKNNIIEPYTILPANKKQTFFSLLAWPWFKADRFYISLQDIETTLKNSFQELTKDTNLDANKILETIIKQHGILTQQINERYSFANLYFMEFYTALYLKEHPENIDYLLNHLTERRWREVFVFTCELLNQNDIDKILLQIQKQANATIRTEPKIVKILRWAAEKAVSVQPSYQSAAIRAFYLDLGRNLDRDRALDRARDLDDGLTLNRDINLDGSLARARLLALNIARDLDSDLELPRDRALDRNLDCARSTPFAIDLDRVDLDLAMEKAQQLGLYDLRQALQGLKETTPGKNVHWTQWKKWAEDLRRIMLIHRNLGHSFDLDKKESNLLRDYLYINKLIADCLNSTCPVSDNTRQQILNKFLMPFDE